MNVIAPQKPKSAVTLEEIERRREAVRRADAHNRIEGICRDPETDPVFEAFIRGDIDARGIVQRLDQLRGLARA